MRLSYYFHLILMISLGLIANISSAFSLEALTTQLQQPKNIQGEFTQERHLKSANIPMRTQGTFAIQPHKGLYWQINQPLSLRLLMNRHGIAQWNPQNQRWQYSPQGMQTTQIKLFMAVLSGDIATLSQYFTIALSGQAEKWQITLTPKTLIMKQIFQNIVIDGGQYVQNITLSEAQGDKTVILFTHQHADLVLPADIAQALQ